MRDGYLESTGVEGLGGTHQVLEWRVRLNPPPQRWKGFSPFGFAQGGVGTLLPAPWGLQSSCAALEGSRCRCEREVTAPLIYKALSDIKMIKHTHL